MIRRPFAVALALAILLAGSAGALWFHKTLRGAERAALATYLEDRSRYARADLLSSIRAQIQAQQRMAARLLDSRLSDEPGWREDARRYQLDHPYYRALSVLDDQLVTRWDQSWGIRHAQAGQPYPMSDSYRERLLEAARSGELVVTESFDLPDGRRGVVFISPIGVGADHLGYLAAVLTVPDAVDSMLSEVFRDKLHVRVLIDGEEVYPFPPLDWPSQVDWQSGFFLDLDDDSRGFQFQFAASATEIANVRTALPMVALVGGIAIAFLLAFLTYLGLSARRQASSMSVANRRLEREIQERELVERELEFLVKHDPLTGLPNRTGASQALERFLVEAHDGPGKLALMFLDLDQFKDINDSLGHQMGDQLLCEIPRRLAGVLRDSDFIGRHGGDEFLIALRRDSRSQIEQLAGHLLRSLDESFEIERNSFFISASIGIAYYPDAGESVNELIQNADTALFKAKQAGRNQFAVFTREMFDQAQHRLTLSRDIRQALDAGQFHLVYQPIVELESMKLVGLEALLRWKHESGYMVPPQEFIRVAEETGMIGRLGEFAMRQALSDLGRWKALTGRPPWLAVNISGAQIRESDFAERLSVMLHEARIEPSLLHLEITEEVLIENLMRNRRTLQKLDGIGMRIVVDDFGVGYSSLAYLKNFPISVVKIDRGFVQDLANDPEDQAITRTICSLTRDLGMATVAEGIEHPEQLALLRSFQCIHGQGYLFSRPVEAPRIEAMLMESVDWTHLMDS
ncbi:hypothetical protein WM2015_2529 [Wenzhouxiangella marina]|uniref:Diguanylate cyclase n=2 Tax=Wenzhouxiangella marina TaxID=1579979 RepID=A0A0K0XZ28_9GAMM|nr:hypothetical protein WM2015_2529 [Wenzhouxiangella marina]